MNGKRILSFFLVLILLSGCGGTDDQPVQEDLDSSEVNSDLPSPDSNQTADKVDVLANDEKIIEMLKKTGVISEDASPEEIEKALQKYLKDKNSNQLINEKEKKKYIEEIKKKIQEGNSSEGDTDN
jgi:bacillopeptidase F (M6 metalloprotease family)